MRNRDPKKKQKGQESTIGKIIYGFLLFLPLLAIGVTCGYAMFNKNAYQSFEGTYAYDGTVNYGEKSNISSSDFESFNSNYKYENVNQNNYLQYTLVETSTYQNFINLFHITELKTNIEWDTDFIIDNDTYLSIGARQNNGSPKSINFTIYKITDINQISYQNNWGNARLNYDNLYTFELAKKDYNSQVFNNQIYINFVSDSVTSYSFNTSLYLFEHLNIDTYVVENTLSNVFYYSIDKVQQSPLFNWAENSIIYTTTASTCTALSITTPFIPLLMSYWLIISVIYFLYDIALMLVWIIHRKIHELQESI